MNVETKKAAYTGTATIESYHKDSDETFLIADFSELTEPGRYVVITGDRERSPIFKIDEKPYDRVLNSTLKMFYLQRCGCSLSEEYAKDFAHDECHSSLGLIYGTDEVKDVTGGWHDAGDYGRYIVAGAVAVADLLLAYEAMPENFENRNLKIERNNKDMPCILDEVKYELDWMLKMQDEITGAVYHKVTCKTFPGFVMPDEENDALIISPISVTATATFAAVMAMSVRFYKKYDKAFADKCLMAAIRAWNAIDNIVLPGGFKNPEDIITGEYPDACDTDEIYWAAAELYKQTGDSCYREKFEEIAHKQIYHGYGWEDCGSYGNMAYITTGYEIDNNLKKQIVQAIINYAEILYAKSKEDTFNISLSDNYIWGSNMYCANNGVHLMDAYLLTGEKRFFDMAFEHLNYLLGKNTLDMCFITGFGHKSPINPHHRPSGAVKKPMPGMLVGGPDSGLHDEVAVEKLHNVPAAKCYLDILESYSTNEITIYWNAAFIMLLSMYMKNC